LKNLLERLKKENPNMDHVQFSKKIFIEQNKLYNKERLEDKDRVYVNYTNGPYKKNNIDV